MDNLWAIIAVGPRENYLSNLINKLSCLNGRVILINNHSPYTKFENVVHIEDFDEVNIHRWWNKGINYAKEQGASHVIILNDDLDFDENFIKEMYNFMISNKYFVCDADNSGNNGGAAFMINLESGFTMEESLRWWYGDTLLFDKAKKIRKFEKFSHASFKHFEPNKQLSENSFLKELTHNDKKQYEELKSLI